MLLRKENQSLPVQSGKARDSTNTFAIYKIKSNYLILGNAVEIAVGSEAQPVQIVSEESDVYAVARVQQLARVGLAGALAVAQQPEVGHARVPKVAVTRQQAGADAVGEVVEAVGKDRRA